MANIGTGSSNIAKTIGEPLGTDSLNFGNKERISPEEENGAANEMRRDRKKDENKGAEEENKGGTLRQLQEQARKIKDKLNIKKKISDKLDEKVFDPAKKVTGKILQQSWLGIVYSLGTSLIISFLYINFHIFARAVVGEKVFCKLGEEWLPWVSKSQAESIGFLEKIIVALVDFFIIIIFFIVFGVLFLLIDLSLLGKTKVLLGAGWEAIKNSVIPTN